jgi:hypothetical protein
MLQAINIRTESVEQAEELAREVGGSAPIVL